MGVKKKLLNKIPFRKITIDNDVYLWKRTHNHIQTYNSSACVELLRVYLNNHKNAMLELHFKQNDNKFRKNNHNNEWIVGEPDSGVIWLFIKNEQVRNESDQIIINLNRPAVIERLIRHFLTTKKWQPKTINKHVFIEDALLLLDNIMLSLSHKME